MAFIGTKDEDTMYQGTNYSKGDIQRRIIHTVYETKDSQDDTNNKGSLDIISKASWKIWGKKNGIIIRGFRPKPSEH